LATVPYANRASVLNVMAAAWKNFVGSQVSRYGKLILLVAHWIRLIPLTSRMFDTRITRDITSSLSWFIV
jgi:hypothetical protein